MKVLVVHNAYQQRGGEDAVVESEAALLREHGHEVLEYRRHNDDIAGLGRARLAADTLWSRQTVREVEQLLQREQPQVLHAHNTLPLISPSLYWAAARARVPVVQTLHNFRLLCPQALLLREGRVCESCVGGTPLPGVLHGCYRGSHLQTGVLAGMLMLHRGLGTWQHKVHRYIALNEFCRNKFIEGGLPAERIAVKPNFVASNPPNEGPREGLLFVGRLSAEKGVAVLAEAAAALPAGSLHVAGAGPDAAAFASCAAATMLGHLDRTAVRGALTRVLALVFPSIWYETFGLVIIEAFAAGTPVIASRIGGVPGLVTDGETGLLVEPGNAADLAQKLQWALEHPQEMGRMGVAARRLHERLYTPRANYTQLIDVYTQAIAQRATEEASA